RSVRLWFEGTTLKHMQLADKLGQTTRLTFTNVEHNPVLDTSRFTFTVPPGVTLSGDPALSASAPIPCDNAVASSLPALLARGRLVADRARDARESAAFAEASRDRCERQARAHGCVCFDGALVLRDLSEVALHLDRRGLVHARCCDRVGPGCHGFRQAIGAIRSRGECNRHRSRADRGAARTGRMGAACRVAGSKRVAMLLRNVAVYRA